MQEPTSALLYMARDFQKRYKVPCKVTCSVDTAGIIGFRVEAWRLDRWVMQKDAFTEIDERAPPAWDAEPV